MDKILKTFNSVPGIIGSMVCNVQGHLLSHAFPSDVSINALANTASFVSNNIEVFDGIVGPVKLLDFRYKDGRIVIKPVDGGYLILLCNRSINLQLLTIAINVQLKKLYPLLNTQINPETQAADDEAQNLMINSPLSIQLNGMQSELAKVVGPIAKIIFPECLNLWLKSYKPVNETLEYLVDIVVQEINDPSKESIYRNRIKTYV